MFVPINPTQEYNPMDIVKHGWILNNNSKPDYKYVLKLIKFGKLNATNVCMTNQKYYKIRGQDIINYRRERYGTGDSGDTITEQPKKNILPQNQG